MKSDNKAIRNKIFLYDPKKDEYSITYDTTTGISQTIKTIEPEANDEEFHIKKSIDVTFDIENERKRIRKNDLQKARRALNSENYEKLRLICSQYENDLTFDSLKNEIPKIVCNETAPTDVVQVNTENAEISFNKSTRTIPGEIIHSNCMSCGYCVRKCDINAIYELKRKFYINSYTCTSCGKCISACSNNAIKIQGHNYSKWESHEIAGNSLDSDLTYLKKTMPGEIIHSKCTGCGYCKSKCDVNAIYEVNGKFYINSCSCTSCGECISSCSYNAIKIQGHRYSESESHDYCESSSKQDSTYYIDEQIPEWKKLLWDLLVSFLDLF